MKHFSDNVFSIKANLRLSKKGRRRETREGRKRGKGGREGSREGGKVGGKRERRGNYGCV